MRTAILIGALFIADSIKDVTLDNVLTFLIIIFIIMDFIEFLKKLSE